MIRNDPSVASNRVSRRNRDSATFRPAAPGALVCAVLIALSPTLPAQEPTEPLTVDEQTVTPAEPGAPAPTPLDNQDEDLSQLADRIVSGMRTAQARLADGRLDDETAALQDGINDDLARLLAALEQQASQPAPMPGEESQQLASGDNSSSTGGTGNPMPQGGPSTQGESTEGDRPGALSDTELEHRRNLATSVWGHLPEKERDEMLGAFSERFLPAYDDLVRQYYEALATRNSQTP